MSTPHNLLILPSPPLPVNRKDLRASHQEAIAKVLRQSKPEEGTSICRLDIALLLQGTSEISRHDLFPSYQTLLAEVYTLVCISAAKHNIDLDYPGGIDVRVLTFDVPSLDSINLPESLFIKPPDSTTSPSTSGPLTTQSSFTPSLTNKNYTRIFLPTEFHAASKDLTQELEVKFIDFPQFPSGLTISPPAFPTNISRTPHTRVAVGGTFDHLHIGHKLLLTATLFTAQPSPTQSRVITIGITGDALLVNKKHASVLESWERRQERVAEFVESVLIVPSSALITTTTSPSSAAMISKKVENVNQPGPNGRIVKTTYSSPNGGDVTINFTLITDPYGPTITDESISALVISAETRAGGKAVNDKREEKGWAGLEVFEVDVLDAGAGGDEEGGVKEGGVKEFESKISSTEIRRRLFEREKASFE